MSAAPMSLAKTCDSVRPPLQGGCAGSFPWAKALGYSLKPLRGSMAAILSLLILSALSHALPAEEPIRDDRVGICAHFSQNWSVDQVMPLIAKLGVGWIRDDLPWKDLERTPGNYEIPAKTKNWIEAARKAGLKVDVILAYGNPAYPDPYDPSAYAKAAGWLATELADDVQAIEILNEPNNFGFRDKYGGVWNGNEPGGAVAPYLQKYVEILNAAAKEIKRVNPHMTVIGLGTPTPASFRMIALGLAPQVDGLTDHPYGGQLPELVPYADTPRYLIRDGIATADANGTFASQVAMFRAQAKKYGATEKLWHTEWGYPTIRTKPGKLGLTEETQAVYLLRRLLESDAAGVEHTFIYAAKDEGIDPYSAGDNFGLVNNDLSAKQAYFSIQRITTALAGMEPALAGKQAQIESDPAVKPDGLGFRCHTFLSSDNQKTLVAFWAAKSLNPNDKPTSATIELPSELAVHHLFLYDLLSGNRTEVSGKAEVPATSQTKNGGHLPADHLHAVTVSITAVPQLLVIL
jgi:hypothetical protein